jgi:hypothetical protein
MNVRVTSEVGSVGHTDISRLMSVWPTVSSVDRHQTVTWSLTNELERMGKETVVAWFDIVVAQSV